MNLTGINSIATSAIIENCALLHLAIQQTTHNGRHTETNL